ncbi:MAG: hypothetical protein IKC50_05230 [Oscillospiraceae bacterium]|nr:hypothetical protein [Oscillospiraceae bacterium]MBR2977659.1 hypothetical protein [Oscillospiraceae bacterium]
MARKIVPPEINMDDCAMTITTDDGITVHILDTYCRDLTPERKEAIDTEIIRIYNEIQARCAVETAGART